MKYLPFSLANGSRVCVLLGMSRKGKEHKYDVVVVILILLPYVELVRFRSFLFCVCVCVCVCVYNMIYTEEKIIFDYNEERKERNKKNCIIRKQIRINKIM